MNHALAFTFMPFMPPVSRAVPLIDVWVAVWGTVYESSHTAIQRRRIVPPPLPGPYIHTAHTPYRHTAHTPYTPYTTPQRKTSPTTVAHQNIKRGANDNAAGRGKIRALAASYGRKPGSTVRGTLRERVLRPLSFGYPGTG